MYWEYDLYGVRCELLTHPSYNYLHSKVINQVTRNWFLVGRFSFEVCTSFVLTLLSRSIITMKTSNPVRIQLIEASLRSVVCPGLSHRLTSNTLKPIITLRWGLGNLVEHRVYRVYIQSIFVEYRIYEYRLYDFN